MNENKTISQIRSYESNFKTTLMNELRRTSNQTCLTLFCKDYGTFCDDERYEYQKMKRSLLKKLCTTFFRRKTLSDRSKKRCWDAYLTRISSSSSLKFFWRRILIANPHHRFHFAQSYHLSHQNDSQSHLDFQNFSIIWIFISIQQTVVQSITPDFIIQTITHLITHNTSFISAKSTRRTARWTIRWTIRWTVEWTIIETINFLIIFIRKSVNR
jgi:hypothetical protein